MFMATVNPQAPKTERTVLKEANQNFVVDLNEMISQVLHPYQKVSGRNTDLIIRCELLPLVFVESSQLRFVLNELIRMIAHHPLSGKKFIHIFCEKESASSEHANMEYFQVNIHANLQRDDTWRQLHHESILSLQQVLLPYNARLIDHEISTTGSLFSLSLPGKLL
jgi:hypothetical protein